MNPLENAIADVLSSLANNALDTAPETRAALLQLDGRRLALMATDINREWQLSIDGGRLTVSSSTVSSPFSSPLSSGKASTSHAQGAAEGPAEERAPPDTTPAPHVRVKGTLRALAGWMLGNARPGSPAPDTGSGVSIDGDATLLLTMTELLRAFRPDVTRLLDPLFGPRTSDQLLGTAGTLAQAAAALVNGAIDVGRASLGEQFVNRRAFGTLLDGIDALRLRLDRLDAREAQVRKGRAAHSSDPAEQQNPQP